MLKAFLMFAAVFLAGFVALVTLDSNSAPIKEDTKFYDVCFGLHNCSVLGLTHDYVLMLSSDKTDAIQLFNTSMRPTHEINYVAIQVKNSDIVYRLPILIHKSLLIKGLCTDEPYFQCNSTSTAAFDGFAVLKDSSQDKKVDVESLISKLNDIEDETLKQWYTIQIARIFEQEGDVEKAQTWYNKRIEMGGWGQEMFYAQYRLAYSYLEQNDTEKAKVAMFDAYKIDPHRKEPLYYLARIARTEEDFANCLMFARSAMQIGVPWLNAYYVESHIYRWGVMDEYAVCLYYTGMKGTAKYYWEQMLNIPEMPELDRERIKKNLKFF